MPRSFALVLALCLLGAAAPARADDAAVPYWASIRADRVNMRVGPGEEYRIVWVYRRAGLPVKVLRTMEGWRLVRDPDGAQGWMLARMLARRPAAIVAGSGLAPMRDAPAAGARLLWKVEPGVVVSLGPCDAGWCEAAIGNRRGYLPQARLWGAGQP